MTTPREWDLVVAYPTTIEAEGRWMEREHRDKIREVVEETPCEVCGERVGSDHVPYNVAGIVFLRHSECLP